MHLGFLFPRKSGLLGATVPLSIIRRGSLTQSPVTSGKTVVQTFSSPLVAAGTRFTPLEASCFLETNSFLIAVSSATPKSFKLMPFVFSYTYEDSALHLENFPTMFLLPMVVVALQTLLCL